MEHLVSCLWNALLLVCEWLVCGTPLIIFWCIFLAMILSLCAFLVKQDAIYRIKQQFNKEFSDTYKQREQEIARIEDKNQRIRKILEDLKTSEDIWQPQMDSDEKPEKLLTVDDSEVRAFISGRWEQ